MIGVLRDVCVNEELMIDGVKVTLRLVTHRVEWMLCDRVARPLFTGRLILFATLYVSTISAENRISSVEVAWHPTATTCLL